MSDLAAFVEGALAGVGLLAIMAGIFVIFVAARLLKRGTR